MSSSRKRTETEQVAARDLRRGDLLFERNEAGEVRFREVFEVDFNPMTSLCAIRVGDRVEESKLLVLTPGLNVTRRIVVADEGGES